VISQSDLQSKKHLSQRISTRRGIIIRDNDEFENANDSIRVNDDSDSNVISQSNLQLQKLDSLIVRTHRGMTICEIEHMSNANESICSI
jgi:hypothetical protein